MTSDDVERLSRRALLQGAATVGAAGLAATAIGAPALAADRTAVPVPGGGPAGGGPAGGLAGGGPIVVHVRDTRSGDIEVFAGTGQTRLRDKDLAARIARVLPVSSQ